MRTDPDLGEKVCLATSHLRPDLPLITKPGEKERTMKNSPNVRSISISRRGRGLLWRLRFLILYTAPSLMVPLPAAATILCNGNTADGDGALAVICSPDAVGIGNTAMGFPSQMRTGGDGNSAVGYQSLLLNLAGDNNSAIGATALLHNQYGHENTSLGVNSLLQSVDGDGSTAVGAYALQTYGINGFGLGGATAVGYRALYSDTSGTLRWL